MSVNCIRCVKNRRTGLDLLCDQCRGYPEVPQFPVYGSMGGGSGLELKAQREWEAKYGPPPGEPGSRWQRKRCSHCHTIDSSGPLFPIEMHPNNVAGWLCSKCR